MSQQTKNRTNTNEDDYGVWKDSTSNKVIRDRKLASLDIDMKPSALIRLRIFQWLGVAIMFSSFAYYATINITNPIESENLDDVPGVGILFFGALTGAIMAMTSLASMNHTMMGIENGRIGVTNTRQKKTHQDADLLDSIIRILGNTILVIAILIAILASIISGLSPIVITISALSLAAAWFIKLMVAPSAGIRSASKTPNQKTTTKTQPVGTLSVFQTMQLAGRAEYYNNRGSFENARDYTEYMNELHIYGTGKTRVRLIGWVFIGVSIAVSAVIGVLM